MPFGLQIGTDRAAALQQSVQDELMNRGYSTEPDTVMAEYITIMIINNKTAPQITSELQDLIGPEYEPSFTEWLFTEAEKGASASGAPEESSSSPQPAKTPTTEQPPQPTDQAKRPLNAPRNGVYHQALHQVASSAQKRTASARSPSPSHQPNKSRRTDLPTGPRAHRDNHPPGRSLLERMGRSGPGRHNNNGFNQPNGFAHDDIQARIDNIVSSPDPSMMIPPGGMPPNMGMDMAMGNPMMLQEMMMNQMALMAQMATSMGMLNPNAQQFNNPGFPMQGGMPGDVNMIPGHQGDAMGRGRGRGAPRGGNAGRGRGRGGPPTSQPIPNNGDASSFQPPRIPPGADRSPNPVQQPAPVAPIPSPVPAAQPKIAYAVPERPQSPTLCKFGAKCTNAQCRWSHPSPVATAESGIVLSNDACEQGKNCKDADCIKAHVSPAVLKPQPEVPVSAPASHSPAPVASQPTAGAVACKFGVGCTRPNCAFAHPGRVTGNNHFAQQCRFGGNCTRASCPFQHPEGRVLPSSFHRGLSTTSPVVNVPKLETGTLGAASHNRSMTFNNKASLQEKLAQQMKEIEEKKKEVEKAEAAAGKKEESPSHPIAA